MKFNSASKRLWDTFKVNSVTSVPNSKFLVAGIDGYGLIYYHTGTNQIVFKINLTEYETLDYLS